MNSPRPGGASPWEATCSKTEEDTGLAAFAIVSASGESFVGNGTEFSPLPEPTGAGTGWAGLQQLDPVA